MKSTILKRAINITMLCAVIITTMVIIKTMMCHVKHLYSLQPAGSGMAYFFDVIL